MPRYFIGELIDSKVNRVLKLFLENKKKKFYLKTISVETNVPIASVFRIVKKLVKLNMISSVSKGKLKVYRFNKINLTKLIEPKIYKIFKLFSDNKNKLFYLKKISSETKVPIASASRIINKFLRLKIISIIQVDRIKLYKLKRK